MTKPLYDRYDLGTNRTNYMLYIFRHLIIVFILLSSASSHAANADEGSIKLFLLKIQDLMNKRNITDIESFYTYYTDSSARFLKTSYLLDSNDKSKILAQESLNMSKDEYINYIREILKPLSEYAYRITINKISHDTSSGVALITYSLEEYSLSKVVIDPKLPPTEDASFISTNCNMNISTEGGDLSILSTNCIEKIVKKK